MKFLGGIILSVCVFAVAFVAVPQKSIDSAKNWADNAKSDVVKFFTPDKDNSEDKENNKEEASEENKGCEEDVEITKPRPPYEEIESTGNIVEQIDEYYNQK